MSNKPKLHLSERESQLLRVLCFARMKVLGAGDPACPDTLPLHREMDEGILRQTLPIFDFYRCVNSGNTEGIRRQVASQQRMGQHAAKPNVGSSEEIIREYRNIVDMDSTEKDVLPLQSRVKEFIKEQKSPRPRILYIADCHFYHDRICREMDNRGFSGYEELNAHMIRQWNDKVRAKDDVYILGDFCIAKSDAAEKILSQLTGKVHLIVGNHDKFLGDRHFERSWFRSIEHYQEIRDNGRRVILSHYPVFCYKGQYRKDQQGRPVSYMLYGHVHNTHDEELVNRFIMETRNTKVMSRHSAEPEPIPCNMINCFCMFSNYQPMTLDEWIEIDQARRATLALDAQ